METNFKCNCPHFKLWVGKLTLSFNSDGHREQTFSHTNRYIMYWWGAQEKIKHVLKIWCFFFVSLLLLETTFLEKDRFYHTTKHWVKQAGRKSDCVQLASHSSYRCACPVCCWIATLPLFLTLFPSFQATTSYSRGKNLVYENNLDGSWLGKRRCLKQIQCW